MKKISKKILKIFGIVNVVLGFAGIFLPILPTTPFLLLASACFAKSSPEFQEKLLNSRFIGSYLRCYIEKKKIPIVGRLITLSILWGSIIFTVCLVALQMYLNILLISIATIITVHILLVGRNTK